MRTQTKNGSIKKGRQMKKRNMSKRSVIFLIVLVAVALGAIYFIRQRMSADDVSAYKEVGTINYSFQVVDPKDKTAKGISGVQATVDTQFHGATAIKDSNSVTVSSNGNTNSGNSNINSNGNVNGNSNTVTTTSSTRQNRNTATRKQVQSDKLVSDAAGILTGGNYSICTKDSASYAIMAKGCTKRIRNIDVTIPISINPSTVSTSEYKRLKKSTRTFSIRVNHTVDFPAVQFKDLYKNVSGGIDAGIAGVWSMQTSLVYSDGTGGKVVDNYAAAMKKYYEVGTVDIPIQIVTSQAVSTPVVGKNTTIQAYDSSPEKEFSWKSLTIKNYWPYRYSQSDSNHILTNATLNTTTDSQGIITGRYTLCSQDNKYYIMSKSCGYKIKGLSVDFSGAAITVTTSNANTNSADSTENKSAALPLNGNGYSQSDFNKKFITSDVSVSASPTIKGAWKAKSTIVVYSDGTGVKLLP